MNSAPAIQFDAATHTYRVDGVEVPSVTQVLEAVGLIDYSHIPWANRQMALERGRAVHEAIALDLEGDLDEDSAEEAGILGYLEAARAARAALGILAPLAHEERVYHRQLGYAGTLDLRADGLLLDWKTNQAEFWVRFQLAAYAAALTSTLMRAGSAHWTAGVVRRVCVELHEDGNFRILEIPSAYWKEDFQTFVAALRVWQEKTNRREL